MANHMALLPALLTPVGRLTTHHLGIIMPVGPAHDPVNALRISLTADSDGRKPIVHIVVVNGRFDHDKRCQSLLERLSHLIDRVILLSLPVDCGYQQAIKTGLGTCNQIGIRADRVGFLDADAELLNPNHWEEMDRALTADERLDAISGLVVHDRCEVWETLSSKQFVIALEHFFKSPVIKPYIQGGAGGTVARFHEFAQALRQAADLGILVGPTLSARAIAHGRHVGATSLSPCRHTRRSTLDAWELSADAYERSWCTLISLFGSQIEHPWLEFLHAAEAALRYEPDLLASFRENVAMRRRLSHAVRAKMRIAEVPIPPPQIATSRP